MASSDRDDPWSTLQKNFVTLSKKLDLNEEFIGVLYQEGFLDRPQCERLRSSSSSGIEERKNSIDLLLLDILPRQSTARFGVFCCCLRRSNQEHLANLLEYGGERLSDGTSVHGLHGLQRPQFAQSSSLIDSLSMLPKSLNSSEDLQNQSASFQIDSPCTVLPLTSTPFWDTETLHSSFAQGSHQNLPSGRYGSSSSITSFQQVSRGHSVIESSQVSGLQNHSGASSTSSFHRLSGGQNGSGHFSGLNQSGNKSGSVDSRGSIFINQGLPTSTPV
jgi:hypothetical protein